MLRKLVAEGVTGILEKGRRLVGAEDYHLSKEDERRLNKRLHLAVEVEARIAGGAPRRCLTADANTRGFALALSTEPPVGVEACVTFAEIPTVVPRFVVRGKVARVDKGLVGIQLDRRECDPGGLECYRQLMIHFLHHRPLMEDDIATGYQEARCVSCAWVGRVGRWHKPICPACGGKVEHVRG